MAEQFYGEPTLAERFRDGDSSALSEMYGKYSAPMFVIALKLLGRRDLASDAVQRAFVQAWQAADRFDVSRELQPWLYAITRRAAIDVFRRERRAADTLPLEPEQLDRVVSVEDVTMEETWRIWQVRRALDELPADERDVLRLAYHEGMSQSEVAQHLGIALGTVKSRTARAQRHLAEKLAHLREDVPL
ncbi:RNA polymerase sigma factor [Kribbella sindirgiensis]|uniref:Sigma-70 family RNA polymerase sigma factor n=1 Tax=Kribbella sindirgiensis TaxID=1124744 RepID=A0A4R0IMS0_9ACTN|nr:sigma-70 family RNA polymerase sigma factor [Kribbella sindirgiensis]TCC34911.1 sigma-70 family RNA polymerase sigma factor [Kribbella sindirgiensis]